MNEVLLNKFREIFNVVLNERNTLVLFGLFELENAPYKWDVVVAAPWVSEDSFKSDLDYIAGLIRQRVTEDEAVELARVVLLRPEDVFVLALSSAFNIENGVAEVRSSVFNGVPIRHAYLFRVMSFSNTGSVTIARDI